VSARELPCPYCRVPIRLRRARFYPSRLPIPCPSCGALAVLPLQGVLIGLVVMIGSMVPGVLALKPLFARGSLETVMDFVLAAAAFLGVVLASNWLATWACALAVRDLAPYRPSR
jgi:hypothetical protein